MHEPDHRRDRGGEPVPVGHRGEVGDDQREPDRARSRSRARSRRGSPRTRRAGRRRDSGAARASGSGRDDDQDATAPASNGRRAGWCCDAKYVPTVMKTASPTARAPSTIRRSSRCPVVGPRGHVGHAWSVGRHTVGRHRLSGHGGRGGSDRRCAVHDTSRRRSSAADTPERHTAYRDMTRIAWPAPTNGPKKEPGPLSLRVARRDSDRRHQRVGVGAQEVLDERVRARRPGSASALSRPSIDERVEDPEPDGERRSAGERPRAGRRTTPTSRG